MVRVLRGEAWSEEQLYTQLGSVSIDKGEVFEIVLHYEYVFSIFQKLDPASMDRAIRSKFEEIRNSLLANGAVLNVARYYVRDEWDDWWTFTHHKLVIYYFNVTADPPIGVLVVVAVILAFVAAIIDRLTSYFKYALWAAIKREHPGENIPPPDSASTIDPFKTIIDIGKVGALLLILLIIYNLVRRR